MVPTPKIEPIKVWELEAGITKYQGSKELQRLTMQKPFSTATHIHDKFNRKQCNDATAPLATITPRKLQKPAHQLVPAMHLYKWPLQLHWQETIYKFKAQCNEKRSR